MRSIGSIKIKKGFIWKERKRRKRKGNEYEYGKWKEGFLKKRLVSKYKEKGKGA